ncbi:MAG: hypothetical protein Q8882_03005 [Bacillota bacterium]|nr:hypothetical protein [Bacillota bacterium]
MENRDFFKTGNVDDYLELRGKITRRERADYGTAGKNKRIDNKTDQLQ